MTKLDGTRHNMARRRGRMWAQDFVLHHGFAPVGLPERPLITEQEAIWYEVMRGDSVRGRAKDFNALMDVLIYQIGATLHQIRTCDHDFTGRDDSFGIADDTACTKCGVPVMAGNLLDI